VAEGLAAKVRRVGHRVLCRKRSQFVPLRHALEARGIPARWWAWGLLAVPRCRRVCTLRVLHDAGLRPLARLLTGAALADRAADLVALGRRARALASGEGDGGRHPGRRLEQAPRTPWPRPSPT